MNIKNNLFFLTLILTLVVNGAEKESKFRYVAWTAEQLRTADAAALHKRSQELAEIFGLSDHPQKEIVNDLCLKTIQKPQNREIINLILLGDNKVK